MRPASEAVILLDALVSVPAGARVSGDGASGVKLHEADSSFEESASEQAAASHVSCCFVSDPVILLRLFGFSRDVADFGDR